MTGPEIKPGKWRLKDGREVVVLWVLDDLIRMADMQATHVPSVRPSRFTGAEYIGPAVIGECGPGSEKDWIDISNKHYLRSIDAEEKCKELEAETVATRGLLAMAEERCEELGEKYRKAEKARQQAEAGLNEVKQHQWADQTRANKLQARCQQAEQRCEELAKELDVFRDTINGLSCENRRLKRGEFTEDEFQNLCHGMTEEDARRFKAGCFAYWPKLFGKQGVAYEFKDGVEIYRFKSVTVMVRGEREAWCYCSDGRWFALCDRMEGSTLMRDDAEAWCREQLEPKRRKAGTEDEGSACWVRTRHEKQWSEATLIHCDFLYESPYCAAIDGRLDTWDECEVQY